MAFCTSKKWSENTSKKEADSNPSKGWKTFRRPLSRFSDNFSSIEPFIEKQYLKTWRKTTLRVISIRSDFQTKNFSRTDLRKFELTFKISVNFGLRSKCSINEPALNVFSQASTGLDSHILARKFPILVKHSFGDQLLSQHICEACGQAIPSAKDTPGPSNRD